MTKLAMRACWQEGIVPCQQMHDELDFLFVRGDDGHKAATRAQEIMRDATQLSVPILVDAEFGRSWGDAKHEWSEAVVPVKKSTKRRRA